MKRLLVIILLALAVPCLAFGQPQTAQPPKPGPEVQKLAYTLGTWKTEGEAKAGNPFGPAGKFSGTGTCEWFAGGFHVVCRGESTGPRGKTTDLNILCVRYGGRGLHLLRHQQPRRDRKRKDDPHRKHVDLAFRGDGRRQTDQVPVYRGAGVADLHHVQA